MNNVPTGDDFYLKNRLVNTFLINRFFKTLQTFSKTATSKPNFGHFAPKSPPPLNP